MVFRRASSILYRQNSDDGGWLQSRDCSELESNKRKERQLKDMEENRYVSFNGQAMRWGLYMGIAVGLLTILATLIWSFDIPTWWTVLIYLVYIVAIYFCHRTFKANRPEEPFSYSRAVKLGTLQSLYAAIIVMVFVTILILWLMPDFVERFLEAALNQLEEKGMTPDSPGYEQAEMMLTKMASPVIHTLSNGFSVFITGFVVTLIVSIFTRTRSERD